MRPLLSLLSRPVVVVLATAIPMFAEGSPWEIAATRMKEVFQGPIAMSLGIVAIVVGGLMIAFGSDGKRHIAGLLFGLAMAIGASKMIAWLFL